MFSQIDIQINASKLLAGLLALPLLASSILIFNTSLPFGFLSLYLLAATFLAVQLARQALLHRNKAIKRIEFKDNLFWLTQANGSRYRAHLRDHSFIHPIICLLYFEIQAEENLGSWPLSNYRFAITLHYNSPDKKALRRLRVQALHGAKKSFDITQTRLNQ